MVIGLMVLAIMVSPIPCAPIAMAAGAADGHTWGTLYVIVGAITLIPLVVKLVRDRRSRPPS